MSSIKLMYTSVEAAQLIGLSVNTLNAWRPRNIGPKYFKIRSSVRYHLSDLLDFINQENEKSNHRNKGDAIQLEEECENSNDYINKENEKTIHRNKCSTADLRECQQ